jgi:hypothetical protein
MPEKTQHENVKQRKTKFNRDLWKYTVDKDSADATHDSVAFVTPGSGRMFKFEDITAVHAAIIDSGGLMGLVELKTAVFRLYVNFDFSPPSKQDPEVTRFWNECEAKLTANNWEWTRDTVSELFELKEAVDLRIAINNTTHAPGSTGAGYMLRFGNILVRDDQFSGGLVCRYLKNRLTTTSVCLPETPGVKNSLFGWLKEANYGHLDGARMIFTATNSNGTRDDINVNSVYTPSGIDVSQLKSPYTECFNLFSIRAPATAAPTQTSQVFADFMGKRDKRMDLCMAQLPFSTIDPQFLDYCKEYITGTLRHTIDGCSSHKLKDGVYFLSVLGGVCRVANKAHRDKRTINFIVDANQRTLHFRCNSFYCFDKYVPMRLHNTLPRTTRATANRMYNEAVEGSLPAFFAGCGSSTEEFIAADGCWGAKPLYRWDDNRWRECSDEMTANLMLDDVRMLSRYFKSCDGDEQQLVEFKNKAAKLFEIANHPIEKYSEFAREFAYRCVSTDPCFFKEADKYEDLLNVKNGYIDLKSGNMFNCREERAHFPDEADIAPRVSVLAPECDDNYPESCGEEDTDSGGEEVEICEEDTDSGGEEEDTDSGGEEDDTDSGGEDVGMNVCEKEETELPLLKREKYVDMATREELDREDCARGGWVEKMERAIMPHCFTTALNTTYIGVRAPTPYIDELFNEICGGDKSMVVYIQKLMGILVSGGRGDCIQCVPRTVILHGEDTEALDIITGLLGRLLEHGKYSPTPSKNCLDLILDNRHLFNYQRTSKCAVLSGLDATHTIDEKFYRCVWGDSDGECRVLITGTPTVNLTPGQHAVVMFPKKTRTTPIDVSLIKDPSTMSQFLSWCVQGFIGSKKEHRRRWWWGGIHCGAGGDKEFSLDKFITARCNMRNTKAFTSTTELLLAYDKHHVINGGARMTADELKEALPIRYPGVRYTRAVVSGERKTGVRGIKIMH